MTHFAVHSSTGIHFTDGAPNFGKNTSNFGGFDGKVKSFAFSDDGRRFAWIADGQVHVAEAPSWEKIGTLKHPRAQEVCFSPKASYLAVWDTYVKNAEQNQPQPNLNIYDVGGKKLLRAFHQQNQANWQPQWTGDETIMARSMASEVHFFKANDLETVAEKKTLVKMRSFSLSPSKGTHYVTFFMPSVKSAPAYVHLYKYPKFKDASKALANKSFFKVDSVENFWNKQCSAVLVLTAAEVDKSGQSYYGEHMLYYLSVKGDSARVTFDKAGNIHSVAWCSTGKEFIVVYGAMPSKTTLFNHKCDPIAEFGTGARNTVLVNPIGNLAMIGGFGNIAARFEVWDITAKKKLGGTECSDATHINWTPCGQYLITATCSPRLRVNNGYKIWHYTASLQHEDFLEELYAVSFVPNPEIAQPFTVSNKQVKGIESSVATASKQKYVPPSQRGVVGAIGLPPGVVAQETKFLSQMGDTLGEPAQMSKTQQKKEKRKEAAAKKKQENEGKGGKNWRDQQQDIDDVPPPVKAAADELESEKEKKIKHIKKKLTAITKLKADQENGKNLLPAQITKIGTEQDLLKQLEELTL